MIQVFRKNTQGSKTALEGNVFRAFIFEKNRRESGGLRRQTPKKKNIIAKIRKVLNKHQKSGPTRTHFKSKGFSPHALKIFIMMFLLAWLYSAVGIGLVAVPVFGASITGVLQWTGIFSFLWAVIVTIQNKE